MAQRELNECREGCRQTNRSNFLSGSRVVQNRESGDWRSIDGIGTDPHSINCLCCGPEKSARMDPACHGFSPRAALVYRTDFDATFKLMYGEAFRAPSLRQSGSTEVGNPDLQPETVQTIEFAYIQALLTSTVNIRTRSPRSPVRQAQAVFLTTQVTARHTALNWTPSHKSKI
ncbi:MAG: TonB-dependent receptor [Proteobacteria bacterium]|nr:TonB-dependent receptor [Pseudomonadota bacterium]